MVSLVRDRAEETFLRGSVIFFAIAVLIHNSDHLRRGGDSVTTEVFWIGSSAILLEIAVVALVLMRHPGAPAAAAAIGFALALGYISVHFTPDRGFLSDSLIEGDLSAVSIAAATLESVAALLLGIAGALALRSPPAHARPWRDVLRHPVVAAMIAGNAIIFVASVVDRYGA